MINAMRRLRQKLIAIVSGWMPPQDVTLLSLRVCPWELDATGQPNAAFRADLSSLAASGWRNESGYLFLPETGRPYLRSFSCRTPLRIFGRLQVATQLAGFGDAELLLAHLVTTPEGQVVATMTTALPLADPASTKGSAELVLHTTIAPARAPAEVVRAA